MTKEEYKVLWKEAIHLCEIEPNEKEAMVFIHNYNDRYSFQLLSDKDLLLTFIGLVVYEKKFCGPNGYGSATPAKFCYRELLSRCSAEKFEIDFIYDVGDWAADYSTNPYIPMDTYRGYGPREYYAFWDAYKTRVASERLAKEKRIAQLREEGRKKVEAAKVKHKKRLDTINELRNKSVNECIVIIEKSNKPIFYFYELIEDWFTNKSLDDETKTFILSLFPLHSTRHNNRKRKKLENLY